MIQSVGLLPGEAIYTGDVEFSNPKISIIQYNLEHFSIEHCDTVACKDDLLSKINDSFFTWMHIEPISDQNAIIEICKYFGIHPLVVEDILSVAHREPTAQPTSFSIIQLFEDLKSWD